MKKFLSLFVALAMVLSLFAGVGARSAKAAATLTATPSGATFTGGADLLPLQHGLATVTAVSPAVVVTIDTPAVGDFGTVPNVGITAGGGTRTAANLATTTDVGFTNAPGTTALVTVSSTANVFVGDIIKTVAVTTAGLFTVASIINATTMTVTITTSAVGAISAILLDATEPAYTATTADADFKAVATSSQTVTLTAVTGNLHVGDQVKVWMDNTPAVSAIASVTIGGTVTAGNIVTVTVGGTAFSYTALTASTTGTIATQLAALIDADALYVATATLSVINITVAAAGIAGNSTTLAATVVEGVTALTIKTLGGLTSPANVLNSGGKLQLVAYDQLGNVASATFSGTGVSAGGLFTAPATLGSYVISATNGPATATFVVNVIDGTTYAPTSITLTPPSPVAVPLSTAKQFMAVVSDGTTSVDVTAGNLTVWQEDLANTTISATGLLAADAVVETGHVYVSWKTLSAVATVNIGTAAVTGVPVAPTLNSTSNYRVYLSLPAVATGYTLNLYRAIGTGSFAKVQSGLGSSAASNVYDYINVPQQTQATDISYKLTLVSPLGVESVASPVLLVSAVPTVYFFSGTPDSRTHLPTYAMGDTFTVTYLTPASTPAITWTLTLDSNVNFSSVSSVVAIPANAPATLRTFTFPTAGAGWEGIYTVSGGVGTADLYLRFNVSGIPSTLTLNKTTSQVVVGKLTRASGSAPLNLFTVYMVKPDGTVASTYINMDGTFVFVDLFDQPGYYTFYVNDYISPNASLSGGVLTTTGCYRYGKITVAAPGLTVTHVIDPEVVYAAQMGYSYLFITDADGDPVSSLTADNFARDTGVLGLETFANIGKGFYEISGIPASAGTTNYLVSDDGGNEIASFSLNFVQPSTLWNPTIRLVSASTAIGAAEEWDIKVSYNVAVDYVLKDQFTSVTGPLGDGWFASEDDGGLGGVDAAGTGELILPVQMGGQIGLSFEALVWNAKTTAGVATTALTAKSQELKASFKFNPAIVGDQVTVDTDTVNVGSTKDVTVTVKQPSGIERNNGIVTLSSDVIGMFTVPTGANYYADANGETVTLDARNVSYNTNIVGGKYVFAGLKFNHIGDITVKVEDGAVPTMHTSAELIEYITVDPTLHTLTASVAKVVAGQIYPSIKVTGAVTGLTFNYPAIDNGDGTYEFNFSSSFAYASTGLKIVADKGDDEYKVVIPMVKPLITITSVHTDLLITDSILEKVIFTVTDPITGAVMATSANYFKEQYSSWTHTADTGVYNLQVSQVTDSAEVVGAAPYIKATATTGNTNLDATVDKPVIRLYVTVNNITVNYKGFLTVAPAKLTITPADLVLFYGQSNTFSIKALDAHSVAIQGARVTGTNSYNQVPAVDVFGGITGVDGIVTFMYTPNYMGEIYIESADLNLTDLDALTLQINPAPVDTTAPVITVAAGIDGSTVAADALKLAGSVNEKVSALYVGFNKVDVLPDGSFMIMVKLLAGENAIDITAYDLAGNKGTKSIKVTFTAPVVKTATVIILTIGTDVVTVDGKATSIEAAPEIVNSRTFVPIRFIAETFGSTVEWLPETQGITITLGDTTIGLQIGNATAVIGGNIVSLPAAPYIKNGRTMVPLRVISDAFGGDVAWDPATRTITISYMLP